MKILLSGATGLVGSSLIPSLVAQGHTIFILSRQAAAPQHPRSIKWDPHSIIAHLHELEGFDAVIHLAGEPIAAGRWNEDKKRKIYESRVLGTRNLCNALTKLERPPKVLISASAIGYYGNRGEELLTEDSVGGIGFLPKVCRDWENATLAAREDGIRVVTLRFGLVLSGKGGALAKMLLPFKLGLGGRLGTGNQYISWIAIDDLVGIIEYALKNDQVSGVINAVSPEPVTNMAFTEALGKVLHRWTPFPVPAFVLRAALGEVADALLLSSTRVEPKRLRELGYEFKYPGIDEALRASLS